jgi:hypothetical protein
MPPKPAATGRFNLRCTSCGYGVLVPLAPDRCPMCGGTEWEHAGPELLSWVLQARVSGEPVDARTLFRHLNEGIAARTDADELELICECDDGRCFAAVRVTRDDFAALVATPEHYLVVPGHERADEEHVVGAHALFTVVELEADAAARHVSAGQ